MTPEREAQMREMFAEYMRAENIHGGYVSKRDFDAGFLACARALEPMVRDGERYAWIKANADVTFHETQCWLIKNDQPLYSRMPAAKELDKAVDAAMSAALEEKSNATD